MSVTASHRLRICCAVTGIRSPAGLVYHRPRLLLRVFVACALVLATASRQSLGEQNSPPPATNQAEQVSSQEMLRVYLQLQEQLRATQLAIEQARQETKAAAVQNAEALSKGLQTVQEGFAVQRAQDWAAMQRSNRTMLIMVGAFAAMSFLTMLIMTYFQWRMGRGLAEISAALPAALGLGAGAAVPALGRGKPSVLPLSDAAEALENQLDGPEPSPKPASKGREGLNLPPGSQHFLNTAATFIEPRVRAFRTAVIVGVLCAAALAFVLYLITYRNLGFGLLPAM
jgi:hypothetical protein